MIGKGHTSGTYNKDPRTPRTKYSTSVSGTCRMLSALVEERGVEAELRRTSSLSLSSSLLGKSEIRH